MTVASEYPYRPITQRRLSADEASRLLQETDLGICRHCGNIISRPTDGGDPVECWRIVKDGSVYCPAGGDAEQFCEPVEAPT